MSVTLSNACLHVHFYTQKTLVYTLQSKNSQKVNWHPKYSDLQLDQCSTQRNLGDYGKKQSALIGGWLKNQGIQYANIISSPWCRCIDTAKLLNLGSVKISPALG
jgi:hypothetical protein